MKKIVPLKMSDDMKKRKYPVNGNSFIEYENDVFYAINAVLAKTLKSNDDVKVILLEPNAEKKVGSKNIKLFIEELNEININNDINVKIDYEIIPSEFITSKKKSSKLYIKLIKVLEYEAEVYSDIKFGPKALTMHITVAMQFAEKYFECLIGNVIYLKAEWKDNKVIDGIQLIFDYTPLYLLNSFTSTIEASSGEKAIKMIETLIDKIILTVCKVYFESSRKFYIMGGNQITDFYPLLHEMLLGYSCINCAILKSFFTEPDYVLPTSKNITDKYGMNKSAVSQILSRFRVKLKEQEIVKIFFWILYKNMSTSFRNLSLISISR